MSKTSRLLSHVQCNPTVKPQIEGIYQSPRTDEFANAVNSGSNANDFRRSGTNTDEQRIRFLSALSFFEAGTEQVKNHGTGSSTLHHPITRVQ